MVGTWGGGGAKTKPISTEFHGMKYIDPAWVMVPAAGPVPS